MKVEITSWRLCIIKAHRAGMALDTGEGAPVPASVVHARHDVDDDATVRILMDGDQWVVFREAPAAGAKPVARWVKSASP